MQAKEIEGATSVSSASAETKLEFPENQLSDENMVSAIEAVNVGWVCSGLHRYIL